MHFLFIKGVLDFLVEKNWYITILYSSCIKNKVLTSFCTEDIFPPQYEQIGQRPVETSRSKAVSPLSTTTVDRRGPHLPVYACRKDIKRNIIAKYVYLHI
jgi:hypothetical protein